LIPAINATDVLKSREAVKSKPDRSSSCLVVLAQLILPHDAN